MDEAFFTDIIQSRINWVKSLLGRILNWDESSVGTNPPMEQILHWDES